MSAPFLFSLGHWMKRNHIRGGYRLLAYMQPHWRGRTVDFLLSPSLRFTVPIGRPDNCWDVQDLREYESAFVTSFCKAILPLQQATLLDCGADIGLFSASVCARSANIARVVAIEPNSAVREVLLRNVSRLPSGEIIASAVSDFEGFGRLIRPTYDSTSDHAQYLVRAEEGFPVTTIDSLGARGIDIALKIDVEGSELPTLRGAVKTIRSAPRAVVAFESHPEVIARTGVHPREVAEFLSGLAPFRFFLAETGEPLNAESENIPKDRITNIIASSVGA
jgi:FkbM family methyltransferase